jgi:hypothetical protein
MPESKHTNCTAGPGQPLWQRLSVVCCRLSHGYRPTRVHHAPSLPAQPRYADWGDARVARPQHAAKSLTSLLPAVTRESHHSSTPQLKLSLLCAAYLLDSTTQGPTHFVGDEHISVLGTQLYPMPLALVAQKAAAYPWGAIWCCIAPTTACPQRCNNYSDSPRHLPVISPPLSQSYGKKVHPWKAQQVNTQPQALQLLSYNPDAVSV